MSRAEQFRAYPPPPRRYRALLVLTLLAGLLGMHALAPGGAVSRPEHARTGHARPPHMAAAAEATTAGHCPQAPEDSEDPEDEDCGGHHARHADAACASGAVSGGPELPVPAPGPVTVSVTFRPACSRALTAPDGARAPPSLAELQLLRI